MSNPLAAGRRSFGGAIVESSLASVGFTDRAGATLVEASRPQPERPRALLAQNAWNYIGLREFERMLRPYPAKLTARSWARRGVALVNTRRAEVVVALTPAMGATVADRAKRAVSVCPVAVPMDVAELSDPHSTKQAPLGDPPVNVDFVLVPGTVSWYKRPFDALRLAAGHSSWPRTVVFAGNDDGSGCAQYCTQLADDLGVTLVQRPMPRNEMLGAVSTAALVLLPSALESVGFSLGEALVLCPGVVGASPLAAHRDVAQLVGREPWWLGTPAPELGPCKTAANDLEVVAAQWRIVGTTLGLR